MTTASKLTRRSNKLSVEERILRVSNVFNSSRLRGTQAAQKAGNQQTQKSKKESV